MSITIGRKKSVVYYIANLQYVIEGGKTMVSQKNRKQLMNDCSCFLLLLF